MKNIRYRLIKHKQFSNKYKDAKRLDLFSKKSEYSTVPEYMKKQKKMYYTKYSRSKTELKLKKNYHFWMHLNSLHTKLHPPSLIKMAKAVFVKLKNFKRKTAILSQTTCQNIIRFMEISKLNLDNYCCRDFHIIFASFYAIILECIKMKDGGFIMIELF